MKRIRELEAERDRWVERCAQAEDACDHLDYDLKKAEAEVERLKTENERLFKHLQEDDGCSWVKDEEVTRDGIGYLFGGGRESGSESLNGPGSTTDPESAAARGQAALAAANPAAPDAHKERWCLQRIRALEARVRELEAKR